MKKWIIFISSFLSFLAVSLMIIILVVGNKPYSEEESRAIERVERENYLASVERAYVYVQNSATVTVIGRDASGALKAVFVPSGEGEVQFADLSEAITPQQARDIATEDMEVKDILHTKLGMEEDGPVWEVTFLNEDGGLNYVYVPANAGTWSKRILNL